MAVSRNARLRSSRRIGHISRIVPPFTRLSVLFAPGSHLTHCPNRFRESGTHVDSGREADHAGSTSAHRKPPRLRYLPTCSKCSRASAPLHEQQLTLTRIRQPALHGFGGNPHRVAPLRAGSHHSELHGRESTSRRAFSSAGVGTDSIHAPHVGRDWRSARRTCGQRSFNPRAPRGARRIGT